MKKLLSLPPNLVDCFHDVTGYSQDEYFCTHDPIEHKLGSGGGTAWLLLKALTENQNTDGTVSQFDEAIFDKALEAEKRILIHAGGQSRRLPSYAPSGKILTPIPVFRWERGQRLSQDLLQLQLPLYERIMQAAPNNLHTMVVSGDVYIRATQPLQPIPDADVVCYGLWLGPEIAKGHGVFVSSRERPQDLKCMLQKPSVQTLGSLLKDHFYLTDIGVWLLSDRAVKVLMHHSMRDGQVIDYDLYGTFGCCLGTEPTQQDDEVAQLSVAVLPLQGGEFYHFGTSHELLSSTLAIQNLVNDQRRIMHRSRKPHPSIFIQNAINNFTLSSDNVNIWIENSYVGKDWTLTRDNIVTGVPQCDCALTLNPQQCIDVVPIGETRWVVRPYGFFDKFAGDEQKKTQFPIAESTDQVALLMAYMLGQDASEKAQRLFEKAEKISAEQISAKANLRRLTRQREEFRAQDWSSLAANYEHSVFYQLDLDDAAHDFARLNIAEPEPLPSDASLLTRMRDAMFRSELERLNGDDGEKNESRAFALLRDALTIPTALGGENRTMTNTPQLQVASDQIVWARSPVRIDIAGGWTDTPPYCLMEGGNVINFAIELNGQPPIQAFVKPCQDYHVVLRSIDLGATEVVSTYEDLADYKRVGSPFSIPKAALTLAGFVQGRSMAHFDSLTQQLEAFGSGIEITLLSAIPAGSGLGTSSVLAATVLGALNDFCGLGWDKQTIGQQTLALEQMLTTGGGWQDQFGGLLHGVKLLQTAPGFDQTPQVRWLPDGVFVQPEYKACHLLYYTGLRRTAKNILSEIVRRMFLNHHDEITLLREMKAHTMEMYNAIQHEDFASMGRLVRHTWLQNQAIDCGTNPPQVQQLADMIDDFCLGYKLPGAGGGGYMYMIAKDPNAAARIKQLISEHPLNSNARFVEMGLSRHGLQISRS
ncbi:MAG: bifunctional fucokinase/fucose-1-phosphate guanylyltransferase [Prevotella sp.]|nr:bifunctional fucokinase/fucose-1-phosphate guanylyltransferase [Prevotella sp.]MDD4534366.1 bifunctional fucokinase/fucose-1-phosphate guanylyltransferase [Prevotella sp.]